MRINKDKGIGTVIFIVEGQRFEFSLLARIFVDVLEYEFCSKKRGKRGYYKKGKNPLSKVYVFNSSSSNLKSITDKDFLENLYEELTTELEVDVDDANIFYLFDRDPESNREKAQKSDTEGSEVEYDKLHDIFKDPQENEDMFIGGQLLLSYPSVESYELSSFEFDEEFQTLCFGLGKELKNYIAHEKRRKFIQLNKLSEETIKHATFEFFKYLRRYNLTLSVDEIIDMPKQIFLLQEEYYKNNATYQLVSLLTIALMELGIITIEEQDGCDDVYIPPQL